MHSSTAQGNESKIQVGLEAAAPGASHYPEGVSAGRPGIPQPKLTGEMIRKFSFNMTNPTSAACDLTEPLAHSSSRRLSVLPAHSRHNLYV